MNMIPYGKQSIDEDDIHSVFDVLRSDCLTTGSRVDEFEKAFADYVGAKYAVAVSNGTAALHISCLAAGLSKGDELLTSPLTFAASANCALYCNARPVFVDIDENHGLMDPKHIEQKIRDWTRIIIPVHYAGNVCDMEEIRRFAEKHNLTVIEDASHALGASYDGSKVGSCAYSDLTTFSFHPVKHITTGEGGMITTNSEEFFEKMLMLRNHGLTKDPNRIEDGSQGPWHQEMQLLGYNYRLTDVQCALGISQLRKLDLFSRRRREIADIYNAAFSDDKNIQLLKKTQNCTHAYHLYVVKVQDRRMRLELFRYLRKEGIACQVHYLPVYMHPYYKSIGYEQGLCPAAERLYEKILSLPIYPNMKTRDPDKVIQAIKSFFQVIA